LTKQSCWEGGDSYQRLIVASDAGFDPDIPHGFDPMGDAILARDPIFPIFRAERRIERELERARQRQLEAELAQRLKREKGVNPTTSGIVHHKGQIYPKLEEKGNKGEDDASVPN
jgi:hypothetical protein